MSEDIKTLFIGDALREIRGMRHITQEELATRTELTINFLSCVENNRKGVSQSVIEKIGAALAVPASFFYLLADRSDDPVVKDLKDAVRKSIESPRMAMLN